MYIYTLFVYTCYVYIYIYIYVYTYILLSGRVPDLERELLARVRVHQIPCGRQA